MTTHRMGEGSSADTSALPKADVGPDLLEGSGRVVRRVMAVPILLGAVLYVAGRLWPQRVASGVLAVPVLYAFAVAAGGVVTYLLYAKACVLAQDRFRWLSAGFGVAALALLAQAFTLSGFAAQDLFATIPSRSGWLYVLWHAALPTFVLGAVWARRGGARVSRRGLTATFVVAIGAAAWPPRFLPLPVLIAADGSFTPVYRGLAPVLLTLATAATVLWLQRVLRHRSRPDAWVAVALLLSLADLALTVGAGGLFAAAWWASIPFRAAQFVVPAIGLLREFVDMSGDLRRHERGLAERLERELHLAAVHTTAVEQVTDPAVRRRVQEVMDAGGPDMVLQPVYDLRSGRILAVEALARFAGEPPRGPDAWFSDAGACGLGTELEMAAVNAALQMLPELPSHVDLNVNVSPDVLVAGQFLQAVQRIDGSRVVAEVTEHAAVDDYVRLAAAVERLRALGLRLAVDDAGAGFASFRHILRLSPDIIKLDITLTRDIHIDPVRQSLASSLVRFAEDTGMRIIAEGVEQEEELTQLKDLGINYAQGYHLGRPAPSPLADNPLRHLVSPREHDRRTPAPP